MFVLPTFQGAFVGDSGSFFAGNFREITWTITEIREGTVGMPASITVEYVFNSLVSPPALTFLQAGVAHDNDTNFTDHDSSNSNEFAMTVLKSTGNRLIVKATRVDSIEGWDAPSVLSLIHI